MAATALPINAMVEAALGADLTAPERTWTYTALERAGVTRLYDREAVTITRGQADERKGIEPATIKMLLDNRDGELTPGRAASTLSPFFDLGCPIRYSLTNVGVSHLTSTTAAGSRCGTPDAPSLDIVGDWAIAVELEAPIYFASTPGGAFELTGKFNTTGNQRSIELYWLNDKSLRLKWSTDGTNERTAISTAPIPAPIAGTICVAAWLDVNDGGGGHKVRFYAAPTLAALVASPDSYRLGGDTNSGVAGTTSVFASTATLDIGDITGAGFTPAPVKVRKAQYRAGDFATGVIQGQPDFTAQPAGTTSFSDGIRTWTVSSPAVIERKQVRFLGQITSITPEWPDGGSIDSAVVAVEASGVFERYQNDETPLASAIYRTVTSEQYSGNVHAYFPFEDGREATEVFSPIGGEPGGVLTASLASDDSLPGSDSLPSVSGGAPYGWNLSFPPSAPRTGWAASWFINLPVEPVGGELIDLRIDTTGGTTTQWVGRMEPGGFGLYAKDNSDPPANVLNPLIVLGDDVYGKWIKVTLNVAQSGANIAWDVSFTKQGGLTGSSSGTLVGYTLGSPYRFRALDDAAPGDGFSIGHLMITSGLSAAFLVPADTGYTGETAAERVARLCTEEAIPYVIEGDPADSAPMGPQRPVKLTSLLGDAAAADGGVLVELPATPGVGYRTRMSLVNQAAAFTVASSLNLGLDLEPKRDNQRAVNDFTATRTDGSSFQAVDDADIVKRGKYPDGVEVNVAYDWQLPTVAGRYLAEGTAPGMRYPQVPVNLVADSAMHDAWLAAGPGDLFDLTGLPSTHPTSSVTLMMEGSTETISADEWDLSLDNSPGSVFSSGVAGTDRADTAGSELSSAANSSQTTLAVATTVWPPWRSTAGGASFPIPCQLGGEQVSTTAISDIVATFGAVGTATHADNASVTPGAPAGVVVGSLLFILAAIRNIGTGTVNVPSGWTRMPLFADDENVALLGRIAQANGEAMPLVTFTGGVAGATTSVQCARFGGTYYDVSNLPVTWSRYGSLSAQDIAYPATRSLYDNSLVLYCGWKSDDWTSVAAIAGATEIGEPSTVTGSDQGLVWDYLIQTTPADIAAGSFVVTGGATGVTIGGVIVLRPDVQTFTVTRSVNGVTKSHAVGADVSLADPMTAA